MKNQSKISRWGKGLAIRIPVAIARQASLGEGDSVKLAVHPDGGIVLRPARPKYELSDLVSRITPRNRHSETDWVRLRAGNRSEVRLYSRRRRFRLVDI